MSLQPQEQNESTHVRVTPDAAWRSMPTGIWKNEKEVPWGILPVLSY